MAAGAGAGCAADDHDHRPLAPKHRLPRPIPGDAGGALDCSWGPASGRGAAGGRVMAQPGVLDAELLRVAPHRVLPAGLPVLRHAPPAPHLPRGKDRGEQGAPTQVPFQNRGVRPEPIVPVRA